MGIIDKEREREKVKLEEAIAKLDSFTVNPPGCVDECVFSDVPEEIELLKDSQGEDCNPMTPFEIDCKEEEEEETD